MATKGQRFKKYPKELKEQILKEYMEGCGWRSLAKKHPDIPKKTIDNWLYRFRKNIDITTDHRKSLSGRHKTKNLTLEDYKERYEILKKYQAFLQARREKK